MALAPGPGALTPAEARAEAERRRRALKVVRVEEDGSAMLANGKVRDAETGKIRNLGVKPAPVVRGENAAEKVPPVMADARNAETQARYDKVLAKAQKYMTREQAADAAMRRFEIPTSERKGPAKGYKPNAAFDKYALAPAGILLFGDPDIKKGFRDTRALARSAKDILMDPGSSRKEKLRAVSTTAMIGGGVGAGPTRGFSGKGPKPTKATAPTKAEQIAAALPEAKSLRRQQEALYSAERGKRAGKAETAMQVGGKAGYHAALAELKGELPKLKFGALEHFDQEATDALFTHVQRHPELRPYEKINTQTALQKVIGGGVPTRGQIKLLERTFGPEVAAQITESIPFWARAKNVGYELINVPRSLRASYDLSAPFRQGLVLGARHPRMFAKEFKPMVKSFRSEGAHQDVMDAIASRPSFPTMQKAKLALTDLEGLTTREEGFMSNYAEHIPVIGRGVRASGRGYVTFLNKFRADAFDNYLAIAEKQGLDIEDEQVLKSIARWINHATGRGSAKNLEGAMVPLNALLFSPRLMLSRLQLLNPAFYAKLDPFARKQAIQGMTQLLGGISLTLYMAKMAGADVGVDPRSSDFGKIKLGDTRVDIAGGLQQYVVAASRLIKGETVSSATGDVTTLEGGFAKPSRWGLLGDFLENKAAPVPTWVVDYAKNENFAGDEFNPAKEGGRAFLPLGLENAYEGFKSGPIAGTASLSLGSIGFGVQTYKPKPGKLEKDFRAELADIDAGVRKRELSKDDAAELKRMARDSYEQSLRGKRLRGQGLKDDALDRQLLIDDSVRAEDDLGTVNEYLAQAGYPPVTADDLQKVERELYALDVQVGK